MGGYGLDSLNSLLLNLSCLVRVIANFKYRSTAQNNYETIYHLVSAWLYLALTVAAHTLTAFSLYMRTYLWKIPLVLAFFESLVQKLLHFWELSEICRTASFYDTSSKCSNNNIWKITLKSKINFQEITVSIQTINVEKGLFTLILIGLCMDKLSDGLRTKWLWARISLQSLKRHISRLFWARSSLIFKQLQSVDSK